MVSIYRGASDSKKINRTRCGGRSLNSTLVAGCWIKEFFPRCIFREPRHSGPRYGIPGPLLKGSNYYAETDTRPPRRYDTAAIRHDDHFWRHPVHPRADVFVAASVFFVHPNPTPAGGLLLLLFALANHCCVWLFDWCHLLRSSGVSADTLSACARGVYRLFGGVILSNGAPPPFFFFKWQFLVSRSPFVCVRARVVCPRAGPLSSREPHRPTGFDV